MKYPAGPARTIALAIALFVPSPMVLSGCGDGSSDGPPKDVSSLKTPTEILNEAKAKEPPKEPAKKP